jgi:hypothetical protein
MAGRESAPLIPVGCGLSSSGFLSGRSCGFRSAWRPRLSSRPYWLLRVSDWGVVFCVGSTGSCAWPSLRAFGGGCALKVSLSGEVWNVICEVI